MAQFYRQEGSHERIPVNGVGRLDRQPMMATFPSALFFLVLLVPFFMYPKYALFTLLLGTVGGYIWLAIKAVIS